MLSITKKFEFEAAHFLTDYEGSCASMHGHTYKLEVEVTNSHPKNGMLIDFKNLKALVQEEVLNMLDHKVINDVIAQPTAENMVEWIANQLNMPMKKKPSWLKVIRIRLYETSNSYAEWRKE